MIPDYIYHFVQVGTYDKMCITLSEAVYLIIVKRSSSFLGHVLVIHRARYKVSKIYLTPSDDDIHAVL